MTYISLIYLNPSPNAWWWEEYHVRIRAKCFYFWGNFPHYQSGRLLPSLIAGEIFYFNGRFCTSAGNEKRFWNFGMVNSLSHLFFFFPVMSRCEMSDLKVLSSIVSASSHSFIFTAFSDNHPLFLSSMVCMRPVNHAQFIILWRDKRFWESSYPMRKMMQDMRDYRDV
jgi:hypothetical protein